MRYERCRRMCTSSTLSLTGLSQLTEQSVTTTCTTTCIWRAPATESWPNRCSKKSRRCWNISWRPTLYRRPPTTKPTEHVFYFFTYFFPWVYCTPSLLWPWLGGVRDGHRKYTFSVIWSFEKNSQSFLEIFFWVWFWKFSWRLKNCGDWVCFFCTNSPRKRQKLCEFVDIYFWSFSTNSITNYNETSLSEHCLSGVNRLWIFTEAFSEFFL